MNDYSTTNDHSTERNRDVKLFWASYKSGSACVAAATRAFVVSSVP